jgi:proline iminopeptidase
MDAIRHLPAHLIHGRYDMFTPFTSTWQLHQMWENSELTVIRHAGHASFEPGMVDAIVLATQSMWHRFYS